MVNEIDARGSRNVGESDYRCFGTLGDSPRCRRVNGLFGASVLGDSRDEVPDSGHHQDGEDDDHRPAKGLSYYGVIYRYLFFLQFVQVRLLWIFIVLSCVGHRYILSCLSVFY